MREKAWPVIPLTASSGIFTAGGNWGVYQEEALLLYLLVGEGVALLGGQQGRRAVV